MCILWQPEFFILSFTLLFILKQNPRIRGRENIILYSKSPIVLFISANARKNLFVGYQFVGYQFVDCGYQFVGYQFVKNWSGYQFVGYQ